MATIAQLEAAIEASKAVPGKGFSKRIHALESELARRKAGKPTVYVMKTPTIAPMRLRSQQLAAKMTNRGVDPKTKIRRALPSHVDKHAERVDMNPAK